MALDASGKRLPWFKLWTRDFMADPNVQALNWDQRGRFAWALMCSWESETPGTALGDDWAKWMGFKDTYDEGFEPFEALFKTHPDFGVNVLVQSKLAKEYEISRSERSRQSIAGRAGADARWHRNATAMRPQCEANGISEVRSQKSKEEKPRTVLPEWVPQEPWEAFVEMRKSTRAPLTERAKTLVVRKLSALRDAGNDPAAVLEQSVERSYRGVFEVHANGKARHEDW